MRILLSPAKKMKVREEPPHFEDLPVCLEKTRQILAWLKGLSYEEAKKLWACNDRIAGENYENLQRMDLTDPARLTPAVTAYDGIAYTYMAPAVFEEEMYVYLQAHLRILSGFYGILRPMDGVIPYRLEMQAKARPEGAKNLYDFWGDDLYREALGEDRLIVSLASKEYSVCVEKYLTGEDRLIRCLFGEYTDERREKIVQKGVYAKMARGDMVRFMAERQIAKPEGMKDYDRLGFHFEPERSSENLYVFIREGKDAKS